MNKIQKLLLVITAINLAVVMLFPPYDDYSLTNNGAAVFAGFIFVFAELANNFQINEALLYLEIAVILINLGILWLLTTENARRKSGKKINFRNAAMILVAINLVGVLLFPPFEYISNMTNAVIPTFEGFYFIFSHPPNRVIVTTVLYIEVFFVLINGCFLLLAFKGGDASEMTPEQAMAYMMKMQDNKRK